MEYGTYYMINYHDAMTQEDKEVLISAPHSIERIKEILEEVHPNWKIQDIRPKPVEP